MPTYRAYRLDDARRIRSGVWVSARNDAEARSKAEELCDPHTPHVEVWNVDRFVDEVECGDVDKDGSALAERGSRLRSRNAL